MGSLFFTRLFVHLPLCKILLLEQDSPLPLPFTLLSFSFLDCASLVLLPPLLHLTRLFSPVIQTPTPTRIYTYIHTQPHARVNHLLLSTPILYRISIQAIDIIVCIAIAPTLKVPYSKFFFKCFSRSLHFLSILDASSGYRLSTWAWDLRKPLPCW